MLFVCYICDRITQWQLMKTMATCVFDLQVKLIILTCSIPYIKNHNCLFLLFWFDLKDGTGTVSGSMPGVSWDFLRAITQLGLFKFNCR